MSEFRFQGVSAQGYKVGPELAQNFGCFSKADMESSQNSRRMTVQLVLTPKPQSP